MDALYKKLYECTETGAVCDAGDIASAFSSHDRYNRWMACKAAGMTGDERWISNLVANATIIFENKDPDINSIAIWALARIGGKNVVAFWRSASKSENANQRRAAADLIGEMNDRKGLNTLISLLHDRNDDVSSWAALSLSKLGDTALPALLECLEKTESLRRSIYCVDAIAKIEPANFRQLVRPLIERKDLVIRKDLVLAMEHIR